MMDGVHWEIYRVHNKTSFIFNFCAPFSFRLHFPFMRIQVFKTYWLGLCGRWTESRSSLGVKVIVLRNCTVSVGSFAYSLVLLHRPLSPTLSLFFFLFLFLSLFFFLLFCFGLFCRCCHLSCGRSSTAGAIPHRAIRLHRECFSSFASLCLSLFSRRPVLLCAGPYLR